LYCTGLVDKDTIEDLEAMKKNVVDDIKTAIEKKNEILKSLGDSAEKSTKTESFVKPTDDDDDYEGVEEEGEEEGRGAAAAPVAEVRKEAEVKTEREVEKPSYKKSDSYQVATTL
jgi:hypothetical protein